MKTKKLVKDYSLLLLCLLVQRHIWWIRCLVLITQPIIQCKASTVQSSFMKLVGTACQRCLDRDKCCRPGHWKNKQRRCWVKPSQVGVRGTMQYDLLVEFEADCRVSLVTFMEAGSLLFLYFLLTLSFSNSWPRVCHSILYSTYWQVWHTQRN